MSWRAALCWLLVSSCWPAALARQAADRSDGVAARLVAPSGVFTVGDPVTLKLTARHPAGAVFDYPNAAGLARAAGEEAAGPTGVESFVVEEVLPAEASQPSPGETSWLIRIRPFAPGEVRIPAITLTYRLQGAAEASSVTTEPLALSVKSVLKSPEESPADIKGPWRLAADWWLAALLGLAALAILAAALWLWRRRRRRQPVATPAPVVPPAPAEDPYARALRQLDRLLASGLLAQGRLKEFHVQLSEIVKRFLGGHHGFDALDRTSEEVLTDLALRGVAAAVRERAGAFLAACDLVKFAKHAPSKGEIDATIAAARRLIETGRPAPIKVAAA